MALQTQAQTPPLDWPHYGIGFGGAVKRGFQKYAKFSGRASRGEYWWWVLFVALVNIVLSILGFGIGAATSRNSGQFGAAGVPFLVLLGLFGLAVIIPSISVSVRRLHDAGYSGWFYLLSLIPSIGGVIMLVLCVLPTSPGAVKYGPPAPQA